LLGVTSAADNAFADKKEGERSMRTLLLATAAVFAISCGSALAAAGGGAAGGAGGGSAGNSGGGNGGVTANSLSTPQAQPPVVGNNQTPPTTLSTGTVQSKTSMNPQQNASSSGSQ
jgi:hypothetical protein